MPLLSLTAQLCTRLDGSIQNSPAHAEPHELKVMAVVVVVVVVVVVGVVVLIVLGSK